LEEAAIKIGQFVAAGLEPEETAEASLRAAADQSGVAAQLGDHAARELIRSALRTGVAETGLLHYRVTRKAFLAATPPQA
jgi:hypothetical protein